MALEAWRLDERVVMVSGSTGGIGRTVVEILKEAGARLSLCDLQASQDSSGDDVISVTGDLSVFDTARQWTKSTLERWGRVDALVNVAGLWKSRSFLEVTTEELSEIMATNFTTTWNACQAAIPSLLEGKGGSIVNFSSTAGQYGSIRPAAHYAAAKGAIIAFTKSLARELSPLGVRVNAVSPGPIDTQGIRGDAVFNEEEATTRTLLGRLGDPSEVAQAVLYLVSEASSFTTGTVMCVNGGSLL